MKETKTLISVCIDKSVYQAVKLLAERMGLSVSEYVRRLIINDLDKRTIFKDATEQLKEML